MRNRLTITISDIHKTKTYSFHQIIKKVLLYIALLIFASLLIAGGIIWFLSTELNSLESKKDTIHKEYESLLGENSSLSKKIRQKNEELEAISLKVDDIEELIGLKFNNNLNLNEKVDLAKFSTEERLNFLKQIPSGTPVESNKVTSEFGWRVHPVLKKRSFHTGIDLRAKVGDEVKVTSDGVIEYAGFHKRSGYGNLIIVTHNFGFKTLYGHLDKIKVKTGDIVKQGDLIALSGNSGLSSGPHLHYEVKYINMPLNPINFINWSIENYSEIFQKEKKVKWQSLINLTKSQTLVQPLLQKGQKFAVK